MNEFTVGQKFGAGFAILICLTLLQGYASIAAIGTLGRTLDNSIKAASESAALVGDIQTGVGEMKAYSKMTQFAYALNGMLGQKTDSACTSCHALPNPDDSRREFATLAAAVHVKLQAVAATGLSAEEKQPLDRLDRNTTAWVAVFGEFLDKGSARQFDAGHSIITDRMEPIREDLEKATKKLEMVEARRLARTQAESAASVKRRAVLQFGLQFALLLPAIFLGWRFIRRLTAELQALREAARYMAAGDVDGASRRLMVAGL